MGRAMLSKSLIQFSVDGWSCVPSLLFTWGQTVVEVMKILVTSKRSQACTATLSTPNPAAGHHDPRLCQRLLDTHRQVWVSLLWGPCSSLLGPGAQGPVCALQESTSQSCANSGSSVVGLMVTSKRAYAMPGSAAPRAPAPWQSTADLYLHRRRSQFSLSLCGVPGSWCTQGLLEPSERLLWERGLILKVNLSSYHLSGASALPLDVGYLLTAGPAPTVLLGFL